MNTLRPRETLHELIKSIDEAIPDAQETAIESPRPQTETPMKTLYLPLKKTWYEMIESDEKREEYREFSPYWIQRLMHYDYDGSPTGDHGVKPISSAEAHVINPFIIRENPYIDFKDFDAVCFSYGYTKRRMLWECKGITIGRGHPEWGAPNHDVFIIKLGKRIEQ